MSTTRINQLLSKKAPPINEDLSIIDAVVLMKKYTISSLVITDNKNTPKGIFTEYDALKLVADGIDKQIALKKYMTKDLFCVADDTYIHDAYVLMEQKGYRHVIVIDKYGEYLGVVSEGDFLRQMGLDSSNEINHVEDVMHKGVVSVDISTSVGEVAKLIRQRRVDYAVLTKDGDVNGIVTDRDIAYHFANYPDDSSSDIEFIERVKMFTIKENSTLQEATDLIKKHGVHHLVILNNDRKLIGVVNRHDILKAMHSSYFDFLIQTIENKNKNEQRLLKQTQELENLANYDLLTSLPNRLKFKTTLNALVAEALMSDSELAVVFLDLDRFQDINDSYGHSVGDELLKLLSIRLLESVDKKSVVSRLGGDEFAIIFENITSKDDISNRVENILQSISKVFSLSNNLSLHVNASAGVVFAPSSAKDVEDIIKYADSALNQAKLDGRGLYRLYSDNITTKYQEKIEYENALRFALKNGELDVYYQPQVDIKTDTIVSAEALIRWNHPDKGSILPSFFIPLAEESGLINDISQFVIDRVCKDGNILIESGHNIKLAINISPNQIKYQNILDFVLEAIETNKYDASLLEIEITEGSIMQRESQMVELLHVLKEHKIHLAIDDFGTGYSSLSYLKKFPVDILKIDKSFIDELHQDEDKAIVIAIIELAKALGFKVLAEGVETKEQLSFLQKRGCELYQGYLMSKALPFEEFLKFINTNK
jgi:diguanylate cyclase (GGDEF)-like protein